MTSISWPERRKQAQSSRSGGPSGLEVRACWTPGLLVYSEGAEDISYGPMLYDNLGQLPDGWGIKPIPISVVMRMARSAESGRFLSQSLNKTQFISELLMPLFAFSPVTFAATYASLCFSGRLVFEGFVCGGRAPIPSSVGVLSSLGPHPSRAPANHNNMELKYIKSVVQGFRTRKSRENFWFT